MSILEDDAVEGDSISSDVTPVASVVEKLDQYISDLSDSEIAKLASFLKDWNTNAKHCFVAQSLISSLFRVVRVDRMKGIKELKDVFQALEVYSERHYQRIDRLQQGSYLLEYIASMMRLLPNVSAEAEMNKAAVSLKNIPAEDDSGELTIFSSTSKLEDLDDSSDEEEYSVHINAKSVVTSGSTVEKKRKAGKAESSDHAGGSSTKNGRKSSKAKINI